VYECFRPVLGSILLLNIVKWAVKHILRNFEKHQLLLFQILETSNFEVFTQNHEFLAILGLLQPPNVRVLNFLA